MMVLVASHSIEPEQAETGHIEAGGPPGGERSSSCQSCQRCSYDVQQLSQLTLRPEALLADSTKTVDYAKISLSDFFSSPKYQRTLFRYRLSVTAARSTLFLEEEYD